MPEVKDKNAVASMKAIPEDRSVRAFMDAWKATNGSSDPRTMLDRYFWSYLDPVLRHRGSEMNEMDRWCNDTLGPENWYRMFNKMWFTSESELVLFKLAWSGEVKNG